ncbi:hypothetical protein PQO03_21380 [Lentisphaera profundi]|uniref:OmpR/PhoB-type domain-containing protein n=1 Tax=Lentisphaera profundi TaxID=1658616 RepID=A0ABY7W257_9BACT|nr:hypothetical protein [Lentisphaera profundi]WDE98368.1 hypothetical protein PQO03_21380 [Lentisphaera profundi]
MINLQKEYQQALKAKNSIKKSFIIKLQKLLLKAKDKPPSDFSAEAQLLLFLIKSPQIISTQEFDALIISLHRNEKALCKEGLLKVS